MVSSTSDLVNALSHAPVAHIVSSIGHSLLHVQAITSRAAVFNASVLEYRRNAAERYFIVYVPIAGRGVTRD